MGAKSPVASVVEFFFLLSSLSGGVESSSLSSLSKVHSVSLSSDSEFIRSSCISASVKEREAEARAFAIGKECLRGNAYGSRLYKNLRLSSKGETTTQSIDSIGYS
uniref:Putative secreted protein n=1 Tax=Ixodes ricinus TaxID=34613 RepID=A0A147BK11_IXORI